MSGKKAGVDKQNADKQIAGRCVGRQGQVSSEAETRHTHACKLGMYRTKEGKTRRKQGRGCGRDKLYPAIYRINQILPISSCLKTLVK